MDAEASHLAAGTRLGPYEVAGLIGSGGMGEVYRAKDTRLGRFVAVKVLRGESAADPERRQRFEREARAVAALAHPHICAVFDVGREVTGAGVVDFLVLELLDGETLAVRLQRGRLPADQVLKVGGEVASALAQAHRAGVVHRDVKPANIVLTKAGAKLLDFGLARLRPPADDEEAPADETGSDTLTVPGLALGTYPYMAPEQLLGRAVDARADLFSLGAVLHEMVTGQRAFAAPNRTDLRRAILEGQPEPITSLIPDSPRALDRLIRSCLAKDPEERLQSAHDVALELRAIAEDQAASVRARPVPGPSPRGRRLWAAAAAMAVISAAAAAWVFWRLGREDPHPPPVFTQLTFRRGTVQHARFTPDGGSVVFGAWWDGRPPEIFLRRLDSPDAVSLGLPPARLLSVSSRGEAAIQLLPSEERGALAAGRLAVVPLSGGAVRPVLDGVLNADWAPNGRDLAAVRWVDGRAQVEYPLGTVLPCPACTGESHVRVSPRGDRLAVDTDQGIAVIDRAGKATHFELGGFVHGFTWTESGDALLVVAGQEKARAIFRRVTLDGEVTDLYSAPGVVWLLDVARDGRVLMYHGQESWSDLVKLPSASEEREVGVSGWSFARGLSADGSRVLLGDAQAGPSSSIVLVPAAGGPPMRLGEGLPCGLSADGNWVLVGTREGGNTRLDRLELRSTTAQPTVPVPLGDLQPQLHFAPGTEVAWHIGGDAVGFWAAEPGRPLRSFLVALPNGTPKAVTPEGVLAIHGSPSRGRVLGWSSDGLLALYPVEGGPVQAVHARMPSGGFVHPVRVSGDGRFLFVREGSVPARISRIELASGEVMPWASLRPRDPAGVANIFGIFLTPDGRGYAYTHGRYLQDLFLVEGLAH